MRRPSRPPSIAARERGVVLLFGLFAIVILLVGTAALVRSMNTAMFASGNFAFKRDLTNQSERAMVRVLDTVKTGPLAVAATREANSVADNYSATLLPGNAQGIPLALLSDSQFAAVGTSNNDITISDMGVTVRYVVDRMSASAGPATVDNTVMADYAVPAGGSSSELNTAMDASSAGVGAVPTQVVYRVSIRVTGPRRTQSFFQTTFKL